MSKILIPNYAFHSQYTIQISDVFNSITLSLYIYGYILLINDELVYINDAFGFLYFRYALRQHCRVFPRAFGRTTQSVAPSAWPASKKNQIKPSYVMQSGYNKEIRVSESYLFPRVRTAQRVSAMINGVNLSNKWRKDVAFLFAFLLLCLASITPVGLFAHVAVIYYAERRGAASRSVAFCCCKSCLSA